jgi:hypothetical protein
MANRKILANSLGCIGIAFSPPPIWILAVMHFHSKWFDDLPFNGWAVIWVFGFVLMCAAGWLGSRWWLFGALLAAISFFGTIALLASIPF